MHRHHHTTTTTAPRRRGLFHRRAHHHHLGTTTYEEPRRRGGLFHHRVQHQKRHATLGDKISGAFLRLKGTLTGRPGEKAAGSRRMHGTDGRGVHRRRRFW